MNVSTRFVYTLLLVIACTQIMRADGGYSFDIICDSKKIDASKQGRAGTGVTSKTEVWAYHVAIVNRSFKDASNIEIKYISFMKPDEAGEKMQPGVGKLKRKEGDVKVPIIKNLDKYEFTTDPMTLVSTQLQAGYIWANGAAPTSRDALKGLWVQIFIDGLKVAEYSTPASLTDHETWYGK